MKRIQGRSFDFAVRIVRLCGELDGQTCSHRAVSRQLIRSGTSIGANVEEAQAGQSKADFIAKLYISLKEARETLYWLKLLTATELVDKRLIADLTEEGDRIVGILTNIIRSTQMNMKPHR